jgi:hypothetical protein
MEVALSYETLVNVHLSTLCHILGTFIYTHTYTYNAYRWYPDISQTSSVGTYFHGQWLLRAGAHRKQMNIRHHGKWLKWKRNLPRPRKYKARRLHISVRIGRPPSCKITLHTKRRDINTARQVRLLYLTQEKIEIYKHINS